MIKGKFVGGSFEFPPPGQGDSPLNPPLPTLCPKYSPQKILTSVFTYASAIQHNLHNRIFGCKSKIWGLTLNWNL